MQITEGMAKTILRKSKKVDSWFLTAYGMNLYRGCTHNCIYCDGRAEKYNVEGEFGTEVEVKTNAIEILKKELNPYGRRKPLKRCFILLGGGVGDAYQHADKKYELTRKVLFLLKEYNYPVHVLTKSSLIERDIDILQDINKQQPVIISFSMSSTDDKISSIMEPGVPSPKYRLNLLRKLKEKGFNTGVFLLPVVPFITDTFTVLDTSLSDIKRAGVDFVIFGGMTLKRGRQKDYFVRKLEEHYPELVIAYENIYKNDKWGQAIFEYSKSIHDTFVSLAKKHKILPRIPYTIYKNVLDNTDCVIVLLEHIDYLLKINGYKSPYGYAAYSISKLMSPITDNINSLTSIKGVGPATRKIILETLNKGYSSYYDNLISAYC